MDDDRPSLPTDEPLGGCIDIGDAILWIASLGSHLSSEKIDQRHNEAQQKVLDALGDGAIVAEGYRDSVYSAIPAGAWAPVGGMKQHSEMHTGQPSFSVHSEHGGVLETVDGKWRGIRLKKTDVRSRWSDDLRDDLIEFCREGWLSPKDAQAWARHLQLSPLPAEPDQNQFDPMLEPDWSLGMALAWIMTGSADAVREMWEPWREAQEIWVEVGLDASDVTGEPPRVVRQLISGAKLSPMDGLSELRAGAWRTRRSQKDAESDLWRTLKKGQLIATGRPTGGGVRQEIPAVRWRDLRMSEARGKLVVSDSVSIRSVFDDVAFDSAGVRKVWPTQPGVRRGGQPQYDWNSFDAAAIRLLKDEGDIDPTVDPKWTQASLERRMAKWCSDNWGREPAESMIRQGVKRARSKFAEGR